MEYDIHSAIGIYHKAMRMKKRLCSSWSQHSGRKAFIRQSTLDRQENQAEIKPGSLLISGDVIKASQRTNMSTGSTLAGHGSAGYKCSMWPVSR